MNGKNSVSLKAYFDLAAGCASNSPTSFAVMAPETRSPLGKNRAGVPRTRNFCPSSRFFKIGVSQLPSAAGDLPSNINACHAFARSVEHQTFCDFAMESGDKIG